MSSGGILGEIVARTLQDVRDRRRAISRRELEARAHLRAGSRRPFARALGRTDPGDPVRFICEVKKASPSKGLLSGDLDPAAQAAVYREHGGSAVSVVTEPHFFQGDPAFLALARRGALDLPLLRKDFHVHELQILETAATEADALLFIVAVLDPTQLKDYLDIAAAFSLDHLVEVTDTREAETALKAGARVIGVNNRDLTRFHVDVSRTERVLPALEGTGVVSVAESGIGDRPMVERLERAGVDALLVGESLIVAEDAGAMLESLRGVPPVDTP